MKKLLPWWRWVGGKRHLAHLISDHMPAQIQGTYYETFVGAGAVFLHLLFTGRIRKAVLSDTCAPLMAAWQQVYDDPEALITGLEAYENTAESYARAVDVVNGGGEGLELAVVMTFVNAAGFGGLWRTNAEGEFNTPFGNRPRLAFHIARIREASARMRQLEAIEFRHASFEQPTAEAGEDDVIFADSPYAPNKPGGFVGYSGPFGVLEHATLAASLQAAAYRGALGLHTNHDVPTIRGLHDGAEVVPFEARRSFGNRHSDERKADEVLLIHRPRTFKT